MMRTLTPILSILIAILLVLFVFEPQYTQMGKLQEQIKQYKEAKEQYSVFSDLLENKIRQKNGHSTLEKERLNHFVSDSLDDVRALVDLEALAKKHALLFGNISMSGDSVKFKQENIQGEKVTQDPLKAQDISFEVIGTYTKFKDFLRDVESSLTIFEPVKITLSTSEGEFQQFGVTIRTYALSNK